MEQGQIGTRISIHFGFQRSEGLGVHQQAGMIVRSQFGIIQSALRLRGIRFLMGRSRTESVLIFIGTTNGCSYKESYDDCFKKNRFHGSMNLFVLLLQRNKSYFQLRGTIGRNHRLKAHANGSRIAEIIFMRGHVRPGFHFYFRIGIYRQ